MQRLEELEQTGGFNFGKLFKKKSTKPVKTIDLEKEIIKIDEEPSKELVKIIDKESKKLEKDNRVKLLYKRVVQTANYLKEKYVPSQEVRDVAKKINIYKLIKVIVIIKRENERNGYCLRKEVIIQRILTKSLKKGQTITEIQKEKFTEFFYKVLKSGVIQLGGRTSDNYIGAIVGSTICIALILGIIAALICCGIFLPHATFMFILCILIGIPVVIVVAAPTS